MKFRFFLIMLGFVVMIILLTEIQFMVRAVQIALWEKRE